ncbi:MAG: hypothetical protein LBG19_12520 [Prevotellaceae bacterium]|jgi:hypothetical protein|nr:hypothetical protein [Prevotellaceae bacterium]
MDALAEELFHAYQDFHYNGLPSSNNGRVNVEFEAKLYNDIECFIRGGVCSYLINTAAYYNWLEYITNYGLSHPTWDNLLEKINFWDNKNYWDFLQEFSESNSGYNYLPNYDMEPKAILNMLEKSKQIGC